MAEIPNPSTPISRRPAALPTGASRGIGSAIALQFAQSSYDFFLFAREEQGKLEDCAAPCRVAGVRAVIRLADTSDSAACAGVSTDFNRHFSTPNFLVANIGISYLGLLQDMTPDGQDHMIRTDLSSCFYLSRLAIPRMLHAGNDKLISLSPIWGGRGASCEVVYSTAKGDVNSFTRALARELASSNIQINATVPDAVDMNMNACLDTEKHRAPEDEIPAGRLGTVEEITVLVCQLAAAPTYFTDNILTLSGSWTF